MAEKKVRICLDAGHYGKYNHSPAVKGYYESEAMWKLHLMQKKFLEKHGFEVVTTRSESAKDLEVTARGRKSTGCVLLISNHSNAVGSGVNESVDYAVAYALTEDKTTKIDEISKEIGDVLVKVVDDVMDLKQNPRVNTRMADWDRNGDGVMNDNYYGILHGARMVGTPAIILEHSFHTNTRSTNWLLKDSNLEKLAKAEVDAIAKYFGMDKKEEPKAEPEVEKWYRIRKSWEDAKSQIGAYKNLDYAKKNCKEGYTVFDWNGKAVYPIKKEEAAPTTKPFESYMVRIDVSEIFDHCLNIREKPNGDSKKMGVIDEDMSLTIVEEAKDSDGYTWGLLLGYSKYRNGWIRLDYTTIVQ